MELRQLAYLIALAKESSFTRAAQVSNVAQPALSRQIQKLEREVGLPLVDRTTRRVLLTPAGQEVVTAGQRILNELDLLKQTLHKTRSMVQGSVTLGVTNTPGPVNVPKLLAAFNRTHPGVELIVREGLSVDLAAQLREDRLDLALVSAIRTPDRDQLELEPCRAELLVVLLPSNHPLAARVNLSIADLRDERFVSFPLGATIRETVQRAAASQAGYFPRASIETNDVSRTIELVAEGLGVAVLPSSDAQRGTATTIAVQLSEPLQYEILLAHRARRQLGPAAQALRTEILSATA